MTTPAQVDATMRMWAARLGVPTSRVAEKPRPSAGRPHAGAGGLQRVPVELHSVSDLGEGRVAGYASVTGGNGFVGDMWGSLVRLGQGAFRSTIAARRVFPIQWQHTWDDLPIGNTVAASEDHHGLRFESEFYVDTERGRAAYRGYRSGAMREWSIGFVPISWTDEKVAGNSVRTYTEVDLVEISAVHRGANPATSTVSVNGAQDGPTPSQKMAILKRFAQLEREMRTDPAVVRKIRELEASSVGAPASVRRRVAEAKRAAGL